MIYFITGKQEVFSSLSSSIISCNLERVIADISKEKELAIDTETEGFDPHTKKLLYLQIGTRENQYVIDVETVDIQPLKESLESKMLIMHNAKFDLRFLFKQGFICTNIFDTFIAESVLTTGMEKPAGYRGLDGCLRRYLKVQLKKEIRGLIHKAKYSEDVIQYSAADVQYLHSLKESQTAAVIAEDLLTCLTLENKFVVALAYIEFCGIYLNKELWKQKIQEDIAHKEALHRELDNFVIETFPNSKFVNNQLSLFDEGVTASINWQSDKQVIELFQLMGIDTWDEQEGRHSSDIKLMVKWVDKYPILNTYIELSKVSKLVSAFGESIIECINPNTDRIHTTYRQILDTGRISCGDKSSGSPNLQQIPSDKRHRSCFTAPEGTSMIVCDYASQESRILADISGEPNLVKFYLEGGADLHSYAAQVVYNDLRSLTLDEIKKHHKDKRQIMKGFNFALAYGGTGETVSRNLNIPIDIAKQAEEDYFKAFNGLRKYFDIAKKRPLELGYVLIDHVSRRKSYIDFYEDYLDKKSKVEAPGFWDEYRQHKEFNTAEFNSKYKPIVQEYFKLRGIIERKGLNYVIQGTAASQTKLAAVKLFKWIVDNNLFNVVKIVNLVHDEMVVECPTDMVKDMEPIVKNFMEEGANKFMTRIKMIAESEVSDHWKK